MYDGATLGEVETIAGLLLACAASGCIELPAPLRDRIEARGVGEGGTGAGGAGVGAGGTGATSAGGALPVCAPGANDDCASIVQLAPGDFHTCALASDGYVRCWGSNLEGQLGSQSLVRASFLPPTVVDELSGVSEVVSGARHSCARVDDDVYCWGSNAYGELASGAGVSERAAPERVALPPVRSLSTKYYATCVVTEDSEVLCWGKLLNGQPWDGQAYDAVPTLVPGLEDMLVGEVSVGQVHACAVSEDRRDVRCWGDNLNGYLGDGTTMDATTPVPVAATLALPVSRLHLGGGWACALGGDVTELQCWGNFTGIFGEIFAEPRRIPDIDPFGKTSVILGWQHVCLRDETNGVACFGRSNHGELGPLGGVGEAVTEPVDVIGSVKQLAGGWQHSCALMTDEQVKCWGRNQAGQVDPNVSALVLQNPATVTFE